MLWPREIEDVDPYQRALTIAGLGPFLGLAADTDWGATIFLRACFKFVPFFGSEVQLRI